MKKSCTSGSPRMSLMRQSCSQSRVATSRCLCRCMNVPYERGRYDTESFTERHSGAFIKLQPQASPPSPGAPLAPLRDDVPLTEPCSGRLSAAARADLRLITHTVCTAAPCGLRTERPRPPHTHTHTLSPSAGSWETSASNRWDTTDQLTVPVNLQNHDRPVTSYQGHIGYLAQVCREDACTSVHPKLMGKALRYIYTSETQRGYEDIDWDAKLSPRLKPPLITLEKMADPVSQHFTLKRYHSRPEVWQTIGPDWNRHQIRATYNVKKPFSFISPGQIPLNSGVIVSENIYNIDIPDKDFTPLTLLFTVLPPSTLTAYRPTSPGYTGKAVHDRPHTLATSQPSSILTHQTTGSSSTPSSFGQEAPLSRTITTVSPGNTFLQPKAPRPPIYSYSQCTKIE